jgi:hypothetical protein
MLIILIILLIYLLPQSAGVQFSNRPNIVVTRAEVPVPETRTESIRETLSTQLNGGQQEMPTQPAADTRYFIGIGSQHLMLSQTFNLIVSEYS